MLFIEVKLPGSEDKTITSHPVAFWSKEGSHTIGTVGNIKTFNLRRLIAKMDAVFAHSQ